ncbi:tudor domain-containing 6-like [Uloborus diversus]|uniref:tudor domain-containing 6-like n=1 Tax=Uloborus diversus TaxID=327109 RepID=UPI002409C4FD|nr:tudor domain-containing 6-like [Uloborus diversus]
MKNIEDAYSNVNDNELNLKDFAINLPCCAVFEDDGAWYRGKIQKVNMTSCEVFFVDYGNVSTVPKSKIKVLLDNLVSLPGQALRCKSYNVSPKSGSWSDADIDAFTDMTLDKSFVAQFVESDNNGTYSVNLVNIGKLQEDVLTKEFVSLGHGRLEDSSKILVLKPHAASSNLSFNPVDIDLNLSEAVEVTYGLNPGEIYCQLKSQSADFKTMMEKLQNHYSRVSDPESLIDRPHPGMICVAQFFQDSAWYRATIKKVEKSSITVFYVDYGNSEAVDKKKIRAIIQDFTILPTQAIKCHLKGIKPPGKSWQINSSVSKYYEGDTWCKFLTKENDYYVVEMTCNKKNVVLQLVQDGLALCDEPITEKSKKVPQVQANRTIALPDRELNFVHGQLLTVAVSFIESPSKFWCQLVDESDILDNLMADIEAAYQEPNIPIVNVASLTVSSYCMAKYSEDQAWYRAQIKSFSSQNECEVFFIDYGNSEVVSGSQKT